MDRCEISGDNAGNFTCEVNVTIAKLWLFLISATIKQKSTEVRVFPRSGSLDWSSLFRFLLAPRLCCPFMLAIGSKSTGVSKLFKRKFCILLTSVHLSATLLGRTDDEGGFRMEAYCVKCRAKREIKDPRSITMKNGRPATQGICPVCSTKVFRIGKS